jgi:hypothetical protein
MAAAHFLATISFTDMSRLLSLREIEIDRGARPELTEAKMRTPSFWIAGLAAGFTLLAQVQASYAYVWYPWCSNYNSCGYSTLEQCMATVSGNQGFCMRNPYARDDQQSAKPARR